MASNSIHFDSLSLVWRDLCRRLSPPGKRRQCVHLRGAWWRLRSAPHGVWFENSRYCLDGCLEDTLVQTLHRTPSLSPREAPVHRLPLGLLLLSRQQLTREQLHAALDAQRSAGHGRLGEWLQALGFVTEVQLTAALARQWSCPILRSPRPFPAERIAPRIPPSLLERFSMVPVNYVEATSTLHLAFSEALDYTVLYAIEQMTGCRTEACFATPSFLRTRLAGFTARRGDSEIVFDHISDIPEVSRIVRSYCSRLSASEIRLARCGSQLWVRLVRNSRSPLDLILPSPQNS